MALWDAQCVPELAPGTIRCGRAVYEEHAEEFMRVMALDGSPFWHVIVCDTLPPDVMQLNEDVYDNLESFVISSRGSDEP